MPNLQLVVGRRAARILREEGWSIAHFEALIGASGGPKWLILGQLDRVLASELLNHRQRPLHLLGSSIGSWRHACMSQPDPVAAIDRFERAYLEQSYTARPSPAEISRVATDMLQQALGEEGIEHLIAHPLLHNHVVTARARGLARSTGKAGILLGMGTAALGNMLHRRLLAAHFQRVVFSPAGATLPTLLTDFRGVQIPLARNNVVSALKASGAIPLVLEPERDIPGAPPGVYWDGGIIDYHFSFDRHPGGLLLYPHFTSTLTPGWFDKFLPWRAGRAPCGDIAQDLVLLSPSDALVSSLPFGKIPDRRDFERLDASARRTYWRQCIDASRAMADDFIDLLAGSDPLRGARIIE